MDNLKPLVWHKDSKSWTAYGAGISYTITEFDGVAKVVWHNMVKSAKDLPLSSDKKALLSYSAALDFVEKEHYPHFMSDFVGQDSITDIRSWFKAAKPEPTDKDVSVQTGCLPEEVVELLEGFGFAKQGAVLELHNLAGLFKANTFGSMIAKLTQDERIAIVDACCDINVTSVGVMQLLGGVDLLGAQREVIRSNNSKFENGKPLFNEQGKIMKGKDYSKPYLKPFVKESACD